MADDDGDDNELSPAEESLCVVSSTIFETSPSVRLVLSQPQDSFSAEQVPSTDTSLSDESSTWQFSGSMLRKRTTNGKATILKSLIVPKVDVTKVVVDSFGEKLS